MDVRRRLNQIAASQHSLITVDQAFVAGLSPGQIRHKLATGEWLIMRRRVYAVGGVPPTWAQAVAAAALSLQPGAWVSHSTAGRLWGLPAVTGEEIDILVDLDRRVRMAGVRTHRSQALFSADLTHHLRIPVTSPERTLVDLSATLDEAALGRILDDALRRRLIRLERLRACVGRLGKSPGRRPVLVHALLAARLPGYDPGDSDLETRVLRALVAAGLPVPVQQYRVRLGGRTYRIDLAYVPEKIAIEPDGWDSHRTRSAFDADRVRANALVLDGWTLLRFTSRSTDGDIVASVGTALLECGHFGAA
jgi:very-short-patch-repair endonuclease